MKTIHLLTALLLGLLFSSSFAQTPVDSLQAELQNHFEQSSLPGFAIGIVKKDKILFEQGFGYSDRKLKKPYTSDTYQNLGSVSKTVVGLALVKAIEAGKLRMDTPINDILPFEIHNPYFPNSPILVKHLATHRSSLLDSKYYGQTYVLANKPGDLTDVHEGFLEFIKGHASLELGEFLKKVFVKGEDWYKKKNFLKAEPGTVNEYANLNAALAAYLVEVSTDVPFQTYTKNQIFEPLGMKTSSWSFDQAPIENRANLYFPSGLAVPYYSLNTYPDGGLVTNLSELSLYLQEMIRAYEGESEYLRADIAQLMFPGDSDGHRAFWGMGQKSRNIGHRGSDPGAQTDLSFHADRKIGRIILCNVNAEDNETLWQQYEEISRIIAKYEDRL